MSTEPNECAAWIQARPYLTGAARAALAHSDRVRGACYRALGGLALVALIPVATWICEVAS